MIDKKPHPLAPSPQGEGELWMGSEGSFWFFGVSVMGLKVAVWHIYGFQIGPLVEK